MVGVGVQTTTGNSQSYRFPKEYWSGPLENHKATEPPFNLRPSLANDGHVFSCVLGFLRKTGTLSPVS